MKKLADCIQRGMESASHAQEEVRCGIAEVQKVAETLDPKNGTIEEREERFWGLHDAFMEKSDAWYAHMAKEMEAFSPGLFIGPEDGPRTTDDLERFFKTPKGHERRIHGHKHAGIRIVQEGATLIPTLDAHARHPDLFSPADLIPYRDAETPLGQIEAIKRRKIMRKARNKKTREKLLAELEKRYKESD